LSRCNWRISWNRHRRRPLNEDDPNAIARCLRPGGEASHASPEDQQVGRLPPIIVRGTNDATFRTEHWVVSPSC
jgi:hypothetical protein